MDTINELDLKQKTIEKVCNFLKISNLNLRSEKLEDSIKEICVAKLCNVIGIGCKYNFKSAFFDFFATLTGQAICDELELNIRIAGDEFRLFRYERLNLIQGVRNTIKKENLEESFIDAFNFIDKFKYLIPIVLVKQKDCDLLGHIRLHLHIGMAEEVVILTFCVER